MALIFYPIIVSCIEYLFLYTMEGVFEMTISKGSSCPEGEGSIYSLGLNMNFILWSLYQRMYG